MNKGGNFMRDPRASSNPNTNAAPEKQTREAKAKVIRRLIGYTARHWYLVMAAMVLFSALAVSFSSIFYILICGVIGLVVWGIRRGRGRAK